MTIDQDKLNETLRELAIKLARERYGWEIDVDEPVQHIELPLNRCENCDD